MVVYFTASSMPLFSVALSLTTSYGGEASPLPDVGIVVAVLVVANVVVFVFPLLGTTMVEAMPDSAMVKRALDAWVNVSGPWNEGEEPAVGVFSSSRALTVVAGTGNMEIGRMMATALGPAFFRKDLFGWVVVMPR